MGAALREQGHEVRLIPAQFVLGRPTAKLDADAVREMKCAASRRVVVREAHRFSFFYIPRMIRDEIVTTFAGKSVSDLSFVQYEISNEGSESIQNPYVTAAAQRARSARVKAGRTLENGIWTVSGRFLVHGSQWKSQSYVSRRNSSFETTPT
jgi:hypothetical protein